VEGIKINDASSWFATELVDDAAAMTSSNLTDNTTGSASTTLTPDTGDVDDNFASVVAEFNKLRADVIEVRAQLNTLLAALRITGGCGVLDDNP